MHKTHPCSFRRVAGAHEAAASVSAAQTVVIIIIVIVIIIIIIASFFFFCLNHKYLFSVLPFQLL